MKQAPNPLYFAIFFPLMWFAATLLLSFLSGWFGLMERFPDRPETPLLTLKGQSGSLGKISMSRILTLSVCPAGLRVGIMRIFGPFSRTFLVPWDEISVSRADRVLWKVAKLSFGRPTIGTLTLQSEIADRLARAAGTRWPEPGSFPKETDHQALSRIVRQWLAATCFAAAFFCLAPRLMGPKGANGPPITVALLFPAIVFGIGAMAQYFRRNKP
jgi:hypothetical protein